MKIRPAKLIGLVLINLFLLVVSATAQQSKCYNYQETESSIAGKIERRNISKKETIWILRLVSPACFAGGAADGTDVPENNVRDLQLVLQPEEYRKYQPLVNKTVVVKGVFFHSHTAHHYTKVLLDVESIEPSR